MGRSERLGADLHTLVLHEMPSQDRLKLLEQLLIEVFGH
jgi:hypothetical protein